MEEGPSLQLEVLHDVLGRPWCSWDDDDDNGDGGDDGDGGGGGGDDDDDEFVFLLSIVNFSYINCYQLLLYNQIALHYITYITLYFGQPSKMMLSV